MARKKTWIIKRVKDVVSNHSKEVRLRGGLSLKLHRFACVGPGDRIAFTKQAPKRVFVKCTNGFAKLSPIYRHRDRILVGEKWLELVFKEIETQSELRGYERLSDYHYRGTAVYGRRIPLIATTAHPLLPAVIGYVELSTTFIMNKPRSAILNAKFSDLNGLRWSEWDLRAMRTKTNLIVRIARCVVYPELRGVGLSHLLLKHAFSYARHHWQVGSLKPYFIEITADMLKYLPFAERAGMHFVGFTEGNLRRVQTDMAYILKNYARVESRSILREESAGIVDLQVSYAAKLKHLVENGGPGLNSVLSMMTFRKGNVSLAQHRLLHGLLRLPKPTYLRGLIPRAESFVQERLKKLAIKPHTFAVPLETEPIRSSLVLRRLTLSIVSRVDTTLKSQAVQDAFGIRPEHMTYWLVRNLNLTLPPRSRLLITGPSGSGKTLLLKAIAGRIRELNGVRSRIQMTGTIEYPPRMRLGRLKRIISRKPIIELFGGTDIQRAIYVLNMAGLSEAFLYLKRFDELSAGQQYRAMIARLLDSASNVWVADEFCSTLDTLTANIVAEHFRGLADKCGATVVVAAPHWSSILQGLRPTHVLYLMSGHEHRVFDGRQFRQHARWLHR